MASTMEWISRKTGLSSNKDSHKEQPPMDMREGEQEHPGKAKESVADFKNRASSAIYPNMTKTTKDAMDQLHQDVIKGSSGGVPSLEAVEDCKVLDLLGCVTGRDAFVLSKLVGPKGKVVGIHANQKQIDKANNYVDHHTKQFKYESSNLEFKQGSLEDLKAAGYPDDFFDLIVSNFALNLSDKKKEALTEAYRVLKNGGELYLSDLYANKEIPEEARKKNQELADYISGALPWMELNKIASELGFSLPILVASKRIPLKDDEIEKIAEGIQLISATYRIFKLDPKAVEEIGKGAKVTYKGSIIDHEKCLNFAQGIIFPTEKAVPVDANLAAILKTSRFGKHFDYESISEENIKLRDLAKVQETDPFSCAEPSISEE